MGFSVIPLVLKINSRFQVESLIQASKIGYFYLLKRVRYKHFGCSRRFSSTNSFTFRTHNCGELKRTNANELVKLCGWLQFYRLNGKFLTLRDGYGVTQILLSDKLNNLPDLSLESVIEVQGKVQLRPKEKINKDMLTGEIEVLAENIKILGKCNIQLPFHIRDFQKVGETLRLQYRYLDLRDPTMQHILRFRSKFIHKMRQFLCVQHGFTDVETPTLFRKTPGGAQEFIVPTQIPGKFYSLTQSPQQFKQLLMVGAIDRYFQIAKCYRDEGVLRDRQPEFTQLDLEMSFVKAEHVQLLIERLLEYSWPENYAPLELPFRRIKYMEALHSYGSDKPDLRLETKIEDLTSILKKSDLKLFDSALEDDNSSIAGISLPKDKFKKEDFETLKIDSEQRFSLSNLLTVYVKNDLTWKSVVSKHLSVELQIETSQKLQATPNDVIFITAGKTENVCKMLGKAREMACKATKFNPEAFEFLWVTEFPLFLEKDSGEGLESAHHPFTAPHEDDINLLKENPSKVRALHYDLVLNGQEIGGGSVRINNSQLQKFILEDILKENVEGLSHMLTALDSGCPPHAGIALGLDRLIAILCNVPNIRDVIAFPKSLEGKDPMSGAPVEINQNDMKLYKIKSMD